MCSAALLLAWGCAEQSFGDSALCSSTAAADGTLVPDCANPSCQAMEACRVLPPTPAEALAGAAANPPVTNVAAVPTPEPSPSAVPNESVPTPPSETPHAEPISPPKQTPADTGCAGKDGCANPACEGSDCGTAQVPTATDVTITQISVVVPRSVDAGATCLDPNGTCPAYSVSPFLQCGCAPNPRVGVRVDGVKIAITSMSSATDVASWETQIAVHVEAESTISLHAFDGDGDADSMQEIFGCDIAASSLDLAGGSIVCTKQFQTYAGLADYTITAKFSPTSD